jgi:2-oxoglutarate ferredoxin oxidoreductase subunit alpha
MINMEDAELVIVAYGSVARIARSAVEILSEKGYKVGILRPITLFPFPDKAFAELPETVKNLLVAEMSLGQMLEDVRLVNEGKLPVHFYGRVGGIVPEAEEIASKVLEILGGESLE